MSFLGLSEDVGAMVIALMVIMVLLMIGWFVRPKAKAPHEVKEEHRHWHLQPGVQFTPEGYPVVKHEDGGEAHPDWAQSVTGDKARKKRGWFHH